MREIGAEDLDHLDSDAGVVFASLRYEPHRAEFHAAKTALQRLGASYDWRLRAWKLPLGNDPVEPLKRLYRRTSLALWVVEPGDEVTAESFDRYWPESR